MENLFRYLKRLKTNMDQKNNYDFRLDILRRRVDVCDQQLCEVVKERFKITNLIGDLKKEINSSEMCDKRRIEILRKINEKHSKDGLPTTLLEDIYQIIFDHSIKEQKRIIDGD